jgi:hypothetical protein
MLLEDRSTRPEALEGKGTLGLFFPNYLLAVVDAKLHAGLS